MDKQKLVSTLSPSSLAKEIDAVGVACFGDEYRNVRYQYDLRVSGSKQALVEQLRSMAMSTPPPPQGDDAIQALSSKSTVPAKSKNPEEFDIGPTQLFPDDLVVAIKSGNIELLKTLIGSKSGDYQQQIKTGGIVNVAAESQQLAALKILIDANGDINTQDENGFQPLHHAAKNGQIDMVKYLVENCSANVSAKSKLGTAMELAMANNRLDVVSYLSEKDIKNLVHLVGGKPLPYSMLMLVGEGRAGKTALRNALLGKSFEQTNSTLGIRQDILQVVKDDVQIGNSNGGWKTFDRKNHQEQQHALASMLARKRSNELPASSGESSPQIYKYLQKTQKKKKSPRAENVPAQAGAPVVDAAAATTTTIEPNVAEQSFKIDMELVLHYEKKQQQSEIEDPLKMTLWDFGGQEVFYSMHHLFLKRCGVYLVTFNMEWLLPQASPQRVKSCLDLISFWLRSVKVHTQSDEDKAGAPMFLVGTHKDVVPSVQDHEHVSKILFEHFGHDFSNLVAFHRAEVSTGRGMLWFYPVDNTQPGDTVLLELMKDIEETVRKEEYIKCVVPFEWMAVCDKLQSETRKAMTLPEFEMMCKRDCGVGRRDIEGLAFKIQVQLILRYLSNLGVVMYHGEAGLEDLVITNPVEFLVGAASMIICDHEIHFLPEHIEAKKKSGDSWSKMTRYGIVSSNLMKLLWSSADYRDHTDELELLMVKFGLIVPILESAEANPDGKEYFVPSMLDRKSIRSGHRDDDVANDDEKYHATMQQKKSLTFFIVFGMRSTVAEWQNLGVMTSERVEKEGFLPHGIMSRLIGKAVAVGQRYCDEAMDLSAVKLKGKLATGLSFGDHEFSLREMGFHNVIRVDVHVDNLMVVMSTLQSLARQVVSECVPNLDAVVAAGYWDECEVSPCCIPSHFMIVYGPKGLHDRVCRGQEAPSALAIAFRRSSNGTGQTLQSYFHKYLPPMGELEEYDVFISYRWGSFDSDLAEGMFYSLSRHNVRGSQTKVFLDKQRLTQGNNFVDEFMKAMAKSRVVVPIISVNALKRMVSLDASTRDNVLVEWTLAMQLKALGKITRVHPILVGDLGPSVTDMTNLFAHREIFDNLPEEVSTVAVSEVSAFLSNSGLVETDWLKTTSVKATVKKLLDHLGTPCWDIAKNANTTSPTSLAATFYSDNHDVAALKAKITQTCTRNVMKAVKDA